LAPFVARGFNRGAEVAKHFRLVFLCKAASSFQRVRFETASSSPGIAVVHPRAGRPFDVRAQHRYTTEMQQPATPPPIQPRSSSLPLAREGYPLIAVTIVLTLVLFALGGWPLGLIGAVLAIFIVSFFRDPERTIPRDPRLIISPADGKVIKVARVQDDRFLHGEAMLVSIFMSPLNVHVNRVPMNGRVVDLHYNPGKYFRAFADKASLDNEQNAVLLEDPEGRRLCFVQIAGFLARRIVCYLSIGMEVARGQRYGMIMFGSRADIYLPLTARLRVTVGERARGGETVIAEWP
jgi:phosphatidylserine decarboxylase